ncbi:acyltransferase family protein [Sphingobacterium griseoflavum]|uniref:Acyltransferase n=1 Tax=Sphingobacterium griseoflavum TaxID=1474952 RepID=A0ABQ3HWW8_9SPHI|nr:acyltransferase [Sphingobacterium griseoflavum]GHE39751.1 acyltransferase [Sphingobacterium griseoflavum]
MNAKIESLQIIRAVAAILVVICHIWNDGWLGAEIVALGGYGVDLFFILSGFIMCLTVKLNSKSKSANAFYFLSKRIVRIFPIYIICAVPLLLFNIKAEGPKDMFFYVGNFFLLPSFNANLDYRLVLGPGWTLVYEMIFYYIFSLLMLLTLSKRSLLQFIIGSMLCIVSIYRLFNLQGPQGGWVNISYILGDTLLINFVLGIVCFYIYEALKGKVKIKISYGLIFLLIMTVFAAYLYSEKGLPRLIAYGLPAFFSVSFLTLTNHISLENKGLKSLVAIGNASYSIYLTHYYFAFFKPKFVSRSQYFNMDFTMFLNLLDILLVLSAVGGGMLFYRWVEQPIIKYSSKRLWLNKKTTA